MKISKNELRKMIFETVFHREKALNEVSLRKMRKTIIDAQEEDRQKEDGDVPISDNPDVDKVIKDLDDFKRAKKGPFNPKNKPRAQEAEELLRFAKEAKAGKKPVAPPSAETDETEDALKKSEPKKVTADQNQYDPINEDDPYVYQVNKNTGCWETKKKVGGNNWISLGNNQSATDVLDKSYPSARTDADKEKCKSSAAKGGSKPTPARAPSPAETPSLGSSILHDNKTYKFSNWDGLITAAGDTYPILKSWINDKENVRKENLLYTNNGQILDIFDFAGNHYMFNSNGLIKTANDATSVKYYKNLYNEIIKKGNVLKEAYGKSHATLMRERYWGRY